VTSGIIRELQGRGGAAGAVELPRPLDVNDEQAPRAPDAADQHDRAAA